MIRVVNRILVFVIGAALLGGGALVVIEGIFTWTNSGFVWIPGDEWLHSFETTAWSAPIVIAVSAAVGAVGLLLALGELKPQRKRVAEYRTDAEITVLLLRRSTEAHLGRRLSREVPVSPVRTRLNPGRDHWTLTVRAKAAASTRPDLERAAQAELDLLHAPERRRIKVHTTGATAPPAGPVLTRAPDATDGTAAATRTGAPS